MLANDIGSSVMNKTRSRLTLANRRISLNNSVQYGLTERPSTRDKSPPIYWISYNIVIFTKQFYKRVLPNIHCRPGTFKINGLHFVNTNLDSRSCSVNNGRPSPSGSIKPSPTVISR